MLVEHLVPITVLSKVISFPPRSRYLVFLSIQSVSSHPSTGYSSSIHLGNHPSPILNLHVTCGLEGADHCFATFLPILPPALGVGICLGLGQSVFLNHPVLMIV